MIIAFKRAGGNDIKPPASLSCPGGDALPVELQTSFEPWGPESAAMAVADS